MTQRNKTKQYVPQDARCRFADDLAGQLDTGPFKASHIRQRLIHNWGMFREFCTKEKKKVIKHQFCFIPFTRPFIEFTFLFVCSLCFVLEWLRLFIEGGAVVGGLQGGNKAPFCEFAFLFYDEREEILLMCFILLSYF